MVYTCPPMVACTTTHWRWSPRALITRPRMNCTARLPISPMQGTALPRGSGLQSIGGAVTSLEWYMNPAGVGAALGAAGVGVAAGTAPPELGDGAAAGAGLGGALAGAARTWPAIVSGRAASAGTTPRSLAIWPALTIETSPRDTPAAGLSMSQCWSAVRWARSTMNGPVLVTVDVGRPLKVTGSGEPL